MNNTVYVDAKMTDDQRRDHLYDGQLFVYPPKETALQFTGFAREMICEGFNCSDPTLAQFDMPVEEFVKVLAPMKPAFIHHAKTKKLIQEMLLDFGCDMDDTYLDVPRLRAVTSDAYLTSGLGYAHHPHRDTWYSAPMCQINWWLPIFPMASESSMAFHPIYWGQPVANGSADFNYYEWNSTSRATASQHIKSDTRPQPKPLEPIALDPQIRLVTDPGEQFFFLRLKCTLQCQTRLDALASASISEPYIWVIFASGKQLRISTLDQWALLCATSCAVVISHDCLTTLLPCMTTPLLKKAC